MQEIAAQTLLLLLSNTMQFMGMRPGLTRLLILVLPLTLASCSTFFATRPTQEMYNMEVALKAALEVNADVLAPELYRIATERAQEARREFRLKNFRDSKDLCDRARSFAERAEFEAMKNGGKRELIPDDPLKDAEPVPAAGPSS